MRFILLLVVAIVAVVAGTAAVQFINKSRNQAPVSAAAISQPVTLPPGMRAVTIATDAIADMSGYILPGDRIDILFAPSVPQGITNAPAAGTLLENLLVLAINTSAPTTSGVVPSNLTLAVAAPDVEKLKLADKGGMLSLALRSLKEQENSGTPKPLLLDGLTNVHVGE